MRSLDELLTSEMRKDEWSEYRRRWIEAYATSLRVECGVTDGAQVQAEVCFEDYCGQEGYTARDESIAARRDLLWEKIKKYDTRGLPENTELVKIVIDPVHGPSIVGHAGNRWFLCTWPPFGLDEWTVVKDLPKPASYAAEVSSYYFAETLRKRGLQ